VFEKGYRDDNDQYVPKKPKFKLKDKANNVIPSNLDIENIYRLDKMYYDGKQEYPFLPDDYRYGDSRFDIGIQYLKFYQNGRCLNFSISSKNSLNDKNKIRETDLNHNNPNYSKEYYHSKDGDEVYIERFVYGEGYGMYSVTSFVLNEAGDTLIFDNHKGSKTIYTKEILPINWKKYNVDW